MISRQDLKQIVMLQYLSDEMLDKLLPITDLLLFDDKEFIFRQGEKAERFFMLKKGKVLMELNITDNITVSVSAIRPGYSFGWSSMLDGEKYTVDAVCDEPSELYSFRGKKIKSLFDQDHSLGYIISQRLLVILKKRFDIRTEQFVKTIEHHPDIRKIL